MTFEMWLAFVVVTFVVAIIPGPTVILVVGQAITNGKKSVIPLVAGVIAGDFVAMLLSLAGLGAILAASATLFTIFKWFGVAFLVYLGIKTWMKEPAESSPTLSAMNVSGSELFKSSFLVTALNPKDIMFFVAFLPQFVNPEQAVLPQLVILMFTFLSIVTITSSSYATCAGAVSHKIQNYSAKKLLNRVSGGTLLGAGVLSSVAQRS
jgi:threonine/homoserine/homoserine lactone efflux protein